jgi:hypothetical protein
MKKHQSNLLHSLALPALLAVATFAAAPATAQILPTYDNANIPVVEGRIRLAPKNFGVALFGPDREAYVDGPAAFTATVSTQNADSFREIGNPLFPVFNGSTSIKLQTRKLTTAQIVRGRLSQQGITDPRGYRLLWRAKTGNTAAAFTRDGGEGLLVGRLGVQLGFSVADWLYVQFIGDGQSLLESGSYLIASSGNPQQITRWEARRSGFILSDVEIGLDLNNPRLNLDGLVRIKRTLKINRSPNFGDDFVGFPYETGTISGRISGFGPIPP